MNFQSIIIILAIIIYIFYSQYKTRPVKMKRFIILPLIFIFIAYQGMKYFNGNLFDYTPIIVTLCIISIILGIISGKFVKIFVGKDNVIYQRGGIIAIVFLIATIIIKIVAIIFLDNTSYNLLAGGNMLTMLMLGCQYAARSITIILKEPRILNELNNKN